MTHKVGILNASSNEELYFEPFLYHSARYGTTLTHIQAVKSKSSLVSAGDHPMSTVGNSSSHNKEAPLLRILA